MRKILVALLALGGALGTSQHAHAGPVASSIPVLGQPAQMESVQYYDAWRYRQFRRNEAFAYRQQRRDFRQFQRYNHGHGYGHPGYRQFGYGGPRY